MLLQLVQAAKFFGRHTRIFLEETAHIGRLLKIKQLSYFRNRQTWIAQLHF